MDKNINTRTFSFFKAPISNCTPKKDMTLEDAYDHIRHSSYGQTIKLRTLEEKDAARAYKSSKFDFCTFSGVFTYRDEQHFVRHSGLLCLDFDHLDDIEGHFKALSQDPRCPTALLFRSPSGDGLKWVVPIDESVMSHEEWFDALAAYVKDTYGLEADKHCRDVTRACFLPNDPKAYMDADVFSKPLFVPYDIPSEPEPVKENIMVDDSFDAVVERIEVARVDIAPDYNQWLSLGFALSDYLGEDGREYYHSLSRFNPKYDAQKTDKQYDYCLKSRKDGITIGTFYYLAKRAGIDIGKREVTIPAFTPLVYDDLPYLLQRVCDNCQSDEEADMMLLGSLTAISSTIPNVYGQYDGKKVYPNLFTFVIAPASAGKGRLSLIRHLVQPIHARLREMNKLEWEQYYDMEAQYKQYRDSDVPKPARPPHRMLIIPANSSSTALYQILHDNGGVGFMMETEGDTLANTLLTDHGNYSDGLRKAFHNEPLSYLRRANNEYVEVENPKLSTLLSGTPNQVRKLIPDAENGLFSRFMFYYLPLKPQWNNVFAKSSEASLDEEFAAIGKDWYDVYLRLSEFDHIHFFLTEQQEMLFNDHFNTLHDEYLQRYGLGFVSAVRRMGLIVFRIAMSLSMSRCYELPDEKAEMICQDADLQIAMIMGDSLLEHAVKYYLTLPTTSDRSTQTYKQREEDKKRKVYQELPDTFQTKEAVEIGKQHGLSESTVKRWLKTPLFTSPS